MSARRTWQEELEIIDRTMKAISSVTDPEKLVEVYWGSIGELIPVTQFVALSRRGVEPPFYLITRASRFVEHHNPWTQRDRLPCLSGGILGELFYANRPAFIEDLPSRLSPDDPGRFYLDGFASLFAMPQYDAGEAMNMSVMLYTPELAPDPSTFPVLHWQSGLFGRGTRNLVLRNQLAAAVADLDRELKIVGEIQHSLLPETLPTIPGFELSAWYQTSARAGGDYYDFFPLAGGSWGLFIADVSGHGSPAAVIMAITHAIAHSQPGTHAIPAALLHHIDERLVRSYMRLGTFVTAFYAVLDPTARTLTYARAGHDPPRLVRKDRVHSLDEAGEPPLGIIGDQVYGQSVVPFESGDLLLLYTDGIPEASPLFKIGAEREFFGLERLDNALLACGYGSAAESCIDRIRSDVAAFTANAPPLDDQTLIAIRCL